MKIAVVGGDRRMLTVARLFCESGVNCQTAALGDKSTDFKEAINGSAVTVLPLPCQKGGKLNAPMSNEEIYIEDVFSAGKKKTFFIGGGIPPAQDSAADYSLREDFLLKNAVLTAEGAIELALHQTDVAFFGAKITVIGYGRIGSRLSVLLNAFGAQVTVVARRYESRTLAEMSNCRAVGFEHIESALQNADAVFNTVPFAVLGRKELALIGENVPLIDLASAPGGIRQEEKSHCKAKIIPALALPGKVAPETAGRIIFETAVAIMRERGFPI